MTPSYFLFQENLLLIDELMFLHSNDNEDNDVSQTVRDELLELCQRNFDIRRRLKEAYHTIHELTVRFFFIATFYGHKILGL